MERVCAEKSIMITLEVKLTLSPDLLALNVSEQSWSRSFEQDPAKAKWIAARVGPLQFRARGVTEGGRWWPNQRRVLRAAENSCRRPQGAMA